MSSIVIYLIPVTTALVLVGIFRRGRKVEAPLPVSFQRASKHLIRWRLGGIISGCLVALGLSAFIDLPLGRQPIAAGCVVALFSLLGVLAGELRLVANRTGKRMAVLSVRKWTDYFPRSVAQRLCGSMAALAALLTATTLTASSDDMGRPGRTLHLTCNASSGSSVGPWAGSFYSLPIGITIAIAIVFTLVVINAIVRRGRLGVDSEEQRLDDNLRRQAMTSSLAGLGALTTFMLIGTSIVTLGDLSRLASDCSGHASLLNPLAVAAGTVGILAFNAFVYFVRMVIRPWLLPTSVLRPQQTGEAR